ncbi:CehA/McbA family metallohydrolase [Paenibacillus amylolyticus]|uniref:CehA/McbA family metallohydrolase n=1 Tax=Paenibacillus amylolyticus TaxID=1451 RepID=UPI003EB9103D
MKWLACELHTHTLHSDGSQTLEELVTGAAELGFDAIALTDHNTMSGLIGKGEIEQEYGLHIIPGMEWTTFYGHMVTIGLQEFADWRDVSRDDIEKGIAVVHRHGGIAGLAHPFRIGSPACTGCFWEYEITDWPSVDYIEVWSGTFPSIQTNNHRAFELWTQKLNEGYRIAATSGRDWHSQDKTDDPLSVTYLGIGEEANMASLHTDHLIHSLREGRVSVTMGPLLTLTMSDGDTTYPLGSVVPPPLLRTQNTEQLLLAHITLDFSARAGKWSLPDQTLMIKLFSNLGEEGQAEVVGQPNEPVLELHMPLSANDAAAPRTWIRAECWGTMKGAYVRIAFTNAIYFEEGAKQP